MHKSFLILSLFCVFFLSAIGVKAAPVPNGAETPECPPGENYCLLAPLPLNGANGPVDTIVDTNKITTTYIPGLIKLVIGLAGAIAVVMIVVGGFEYVTSASGMSKSDGKERITNALIGLFIAIGSWLILFTLNPDLVKFNLSLSEVSQTPPSATQPTSPSGGGVTPLPGPGAPPTNTAFPNTANISPATGLTNVAWVDDSVDRAKFDPGIFFNNANCDFIGRASCTSLAGISSLTVEELNRLEAACDCSIQITGGTEYWNHGTRVNIADNNPTPHKPTNYGGGNVLDLSLKTNVSDYIRKNGTPSTDYNQCVLTKENGAERYIWQGSMYVNETIAGNIPHWHVCFH